MADAPHPTLIRPVLESEIPKVIELWALCGLPTRPCGRDSPQALGRQLSLPTTHLLGAYQGGRLVGVVLGNHEGRKGWINRLAVLPGMRRVGIARQLVAAAENRLRADGMPVVGALVEADNPGSLAFFRRLGFALHPEVHYLSKRESPDA